MSAWTLLTCSRGGIHRGRPRGEGRGIGPGLEGGGNGGNGDDEMDTTTAGLLASKGEVSMATYRVSKARRKKIARSIPK